MPLFGRIDGSPRRGNRHGDRKCLFNIEIDAREMMGEWRFAGSYWTHRQIFSYTLLVDFLRSVRVSIMRKYARELRRGAFLRTLPKEKRGTSRIRFTVKLVIIRFAVYSPEQNAKRISNRSIFYLKRPGINGGTKFVKNTERESRRKVSGFFDETWRDSNNVLGAF